MAEHEDGINTTGTHQPTIPTGRVKKLIKVDKDINKINSEALFLISCSTDLFLQSVAEKSVRVTLEKKRKTVKFDDFRVAVKRHQPTADFLLDSFSVPSDKPVTEPVNRSRTDDKPIPVGTRRIDAFFHKCS